MRRAVSVSAADPELDVDWAKFGDRLGALAREHTGSDGVYQGPTQRVKVEMSRWTASEERVDLAELGLRVPTKSYSVNRHNWTTGGKLLPGARLAEITAKGTVRCIDAPEPV